MQMTEWTIILRNNLRWLMVVAKSSNQVNLLLKCSQSVPLILFAVRNLWKVWSKLILQELRVYWLSFATRWQHDAAHMLALSMILPLLCGMTWTLQYQLIHHNLWPTLDCASLVLSWLLSSLAGTSLGNLTLQPTLLGPLPLKQQCNFQFSLELDSFPLTFLTVMFSHS